MLEANPDLTWRDVQHVIVESADSTIDPDSTGWIKNGAGHAFNHDYGFGRLDAESAVIVAKSWSNVGEEVSHSEASEPNAPIEDNGSILTDTISVSQDITIETIEIPFTSDHSFRGDLSIELTSPYGTTAILAVGESGISDTDRRDQGSYSNFIFSAKNFWGERSQGNWTIAVSDQAAEDSGNLNSWGINFYGTKGAQFTKNATQTKIIAEDKLAGTSGQTYASKKALNSVKGLSSYINHIEEKIAKSPNKYKQNSQWIIATKNKNRNASKKAFKRIARKKELIHGTKNSVNSYQVITKSSINTHSFVDKLRDEFGSNLAYAYPQITHDHQSRSVIPGDLLA